RAPTLLHAHSCPTRRSSGLLAYLGPRLLAPLGITGATWESCPRGVNTGGWGLAIRTEDIAVFGQLYLRGGVWRNQQIVPAAWVEDRKSTRLNSSHVKISYAV